MVDQFSISRQGYYKLLKRKDNKTQEDELVTINVKEIRQRMPRLGGRKLHYILNDYLRSQGLKYGRDKLFKLLRRERLLVPKRVNYITTTRSYKRFRKHPNLISELSIKKPEQVWVSDITYIRTRQGFMYLSLITDAYSKKIMGYKLSENMKTENNIEALKIALKNRKYKFRKLIHHSDRGFQYCSESYTTMLEKHKIGISMTTKYDPYENAIAERINGILKGEFLISDHRLSKDEAYKVIDQTIITYNELRPHMSCEYLTPSEAHSGKKFKMKKYTKLKNT